MTFQLCSSCRHSFPVETLSKASFSDNVSLRFEAMHKLLGNIEGKTKADAHQLSQLRLALEDLCGAVEEETQTLRAKADHATLTCTRKEKDLEAANSKLLGATIASNQPRGTTSHGMPSAPGGGGGGTSMMTMGGDAPSRALTFNGSVPASQIKKMSTALELISASIYNVLESLAIQTRVDTALLWLRPRGFVSTELVAPFVVGRDISRLRNSAPYRVSETSIPCAVSTTGIAVNIKPRSGCRDTRRSEEIPLTELVERSNAAQLLMPVNMRYSQSHSNVLAVVHLIGSPRFPFPFNRRNEECAAQAAATLSILLSSHHETMISEWANRFYDPSLLRSTSTYRGDLDLRGDEKGIDDFSPQPVLVYRCVNERNEDADPRDAYMGLKASITRRAVPMQSTVGIKELHRHATTMESNWVSAVEATSHLESVIGNIKADALREEVHKLREQRENVWREAELAAAQHQQWKNARTGEGDDEDGPVSHAEEDDNSSVDSAELAVGLTPAIIQAPGTGGYIATTVLKSEELADVENVILKRLRNLGVDTTPFTATRSNQSSLERDERSAS